MQIYLMVWLAATTAVFVLPASLKKWYAFFLSLILSGLGFWLAIKVLSGNPINDAMFQHWILGEVRLEIDSLSALFLFIINLPTTASFLSFAGLRQKQSEPVWDAVHLFNGLLLQLSMNLICSVQNMFAFSFVWEIMALTSLVMVLYNKDKAETVKAGVNYFVQMHIAALFLLIAIFYFYGETGNNRFDSLTQFFAQNDNRLLFLLFFIGFGFKAGFVPLHSWLPRTYAASPTHFTGMMSGTVSKLGLYGILRVGMAVQQDMLVIGVTVVAIAMVSTLYGIIQASMQRDLKKTLAYSSVENMGIIGVGIGMAFIGEALNNHALTTLSLAGALFHTLNHALFKPILFFNVAGLEQQAETTDMNQMGGIVKKMPYTTAIFIAASLAICGLPPLNGFASEFLIYNGLFIGVEKTILTTIVLGLLGILTLAFSGGLSLFVFTRNIGVTFLGAARTERMNSIKEQNFWVLAPQVFLLAVLVGVSAVPDVLVRAISPAILIFRGAQTADVPVALSELETIEYTAWLFVGLVAALLAVRWFMFRQKEKAESVTWGCGYTAPNATMQYTASTYGDSMLQIAGPVIKHKQSFKTFGELEIFPQAHHFETQVADIIEEKAIEPATETTLQTLKKFSVLQTGHTRHYIAYAFIFIAIVFALTVANIF